MIDFLNKRNMIENQNKLLKKMSEDIKRRKNENKQIQKYNNLNVPYIPKTHLVSVIPLKFFTCWHTSDLPPLMRENYQKICDLNPEIECNLYNEDMCREFIKNNFKSDVLDAYNKLIPCSYKSDLWRFCILFIYGGIYMDIKYCPENNFKLIELTDKEYFVKDLPENCTYTALIVSKPKNPILFNCIREIVANVNNKYYGNGPLDPTGPGLLGKYFSKDDFNSMELYLSTLKIEDRNIERFFIVYRNCIIFSIYPKYREEQKKNQKHKYYAELWKLKNIYYD